MLVTSSTISDWAEGPGGASPTTPMILMRPSSAASASWPTDRQSSSSSLPVSKRGEIEDYVQPGQLRLYRVNPAYSQAGHPVTVEVSGVGYGDVRACIWKGAAPGGPRAALREAMQAMQALRAMESLEEDLGSSEGGGAEGDDLPQAECENLSGSGTVNISILEPCTSRCAPLFVSVAASKSNFMCSDENCRFPDQVRFSIRTSGLHCIWSEWSTGAQYSSAPDYSATAVHNAFWHLSVALTVMFMPGLS